MGVQVLYVDFNTVNRKCQYYFNKFTKYLNFEVLRKKVRKNKRKITCAH